MRKLGAVVLLALPVPLVAALAGALAEHAGQRLGAGAARLARSLSAPAPAEPELVVLRPEASVERVLREPARDRKPAARVARRRPAEHAGARRRGVLVRARAVLRLANAGARPGGAFVPADGDRPAGIALSGVSALGIGLQDGDILTHAGGAPARSPAQVVGMVIASRGARAAQISGRFWRGGEYYDLVVEQPYIAPATRRADASQSETAPPASGTSGSGRPASASSSSCVPPSACLSAPGA